MQQRAQLAQIDFETPHTKGIEQCTVPSLFHKPLFEQTASHPDNASCFAAVTLTSKLPEDGKAAHTSSSAVRKPSNTPFFTEQSHRDLLGHYDQGCTLRHTEHQLSQARGSIWDLRREIDQLNRQLTDSQVSQGNFCEEVQGLKQSLRSEQLRNQDLSQSLQASDNTRREQDAQLQDQALALQTLSSQLQETCLQQAHDKQDLDARCQAASIYAACLQEQNTTLQQQAEAGAASLAFAEALCVQQHQQVQQLNQQLIDAAQIAQTSCQSLQLAEARAQALEASRSELHKLARDAADTFLQVSNSNLPAESRNLPVCLRCM